jgi:hypothetical protein
MSVHHATNKGYARNILFIHLSTDVICHIASILIQSKNFGRLVLWICTCMMRMVLAVLGAQQVAEAMVVGAADGGNGGASPSIGEEPDLALEPPFFPLFVLAIGAQRGDVDANSHKHTDRIHKHTVCPSVT